MRVDGEVVGEIGAGALRPRSASRAATTPRRRALAAKIARLRIFPDDEGRFDRSLLDTGGAALVVSPVHAARRHRRRATGRASPSAAPPEEAEPLYERFCADLEALGVPVARGVFGASMAVELVNDGPVTIVFDA